MKITVRSGVFETNSSSVHAMTMCDKQDYEAWKRGDLLYHSYERALVNPRMIDDEDFPYPDDYNLYDKIYLTEKEFYERESEYYETFMMEHTTASGETVVAFGYYGHD